MRFNLLNYPLERFFQILVIIGIICVYSLSYIISKELPLSLFLKTSIYLVPCLIAVLSLSYIYKYNIDPDQSKTIFCFDKKLLFLIYSLLYILSIIVLYGSDYRPWYYFIIISVLYLIIFFQIFSSPLNPIVMLSEINLVLLNLIYGITFKYPLFFSMTDTLSHISWSNYIFITGHVLPIDYNPLYSNFPLYHILVAISSHLLNLDIKTSLFLITGLIFVGTILFVYLFFSFTIKNKRISLLSCLIYANFSIVVFYGSYMITRVLAFVGFLIMLYLIFKISQEKQSRRYYIILVIPIFIFLVTVHPVSLPQFLIILAVMLVCIYLFCQNRIDDFSILILLIIIFIAYWMFVSFDLANALADERLRTVSIEAFFNAKDPSLALLAKTARITDILNYIVDNIQAGIFFFFGLLGIGYTLYRKKPLFAVIFAVFSICMIPFFIPTPLQSNYLVNLVLGFYRFSLYIAPFMALIMAFGIFFVLQIKLKTNEMKILLTLVVIGLFFIFSILSLTTVDVAGDSKDLWPNYPTTYFTINDLSSFSFWDSYIPNGEPIISDSLVSASLQAKLFPGLKDIQLKFYQSITIPSIENIDQNDGYIFYRKGEFYSRGTLNFQDTYAQYSQQNAQIIEYKLNKQEEIYSSGTNELFLKSSLLSH